MNTRALGSAAVPVAWCAWTDLWTLPW